MIETVNTAHSVQEFLNDAKPWFEGSVAFVRMRG
jgi:hypothetical protein